MKDQYVGDVSDYLKYGLLRALQGVRQDPLMVCWMLTPNDSGSDGARLTYLEQPERYRETDPELFDVLRGLVRSGRRSTAAVEEAGVLPSARYISEIVSDKVDERHAYFERLESMTPAKALVFFDPDNGLQIKTKPRGRLESSKFIFWDEIETMVTADRSAVIFQHWSRVPRDQMVSDMLCELEQRLPGHHSFALRAPHVLYLIAAKDDEGDALQKATSQYTERWPGKLRLDPP